MIYDKDVSLDALKQMLSYEPATGEIRWQQSPARNIYAGELAGCVKMLRKDKNGNGVEYRYIRLNGINMPAQRIAYALYHGSFPSGRISFADGNPLNLRIENLSVQKALHPKSEEQKAADREYYRQHREQHGLSYRESDLKRKFGIGLLEYGHLLVKQNGKCAICESANGGTRNGEDKALAVDHDHKTGKVRGLLCEACNTGIGKLKDDPKILRKAADYLDKHNDPEGHPSVRSLN